MICRLRIVRKMWNRHLFRLAISFLQLALSTAIYTYPKKLRIQIHKDLVYQLNSTAAVKEVTLGLCKTSANEFELISYIDMSSFVLAPAYQRRVEYFGNRSIGHIWYKLRNLTQKDNGCYQVQITPITPGAKISILITTVIVTETPQFTAKPNNSIIITEHKDLSINCSAIGPPTPNVIWINVTNNMATVNQGTGFAVLKIPNITRHYNGQIYKCQAENNPNEGPKEASTVLQVNYKPSIDSSSSNITAKSWEGNFITLRCMWLDSLPKPTWSWYNPNGILISSNINTIDKGSEVTLTTGPSNGDYGLYTCKATNEVGSVSHTINITRLFPPGQPNVTVTNVDASSAEVRWTKPVYNGGSQVTGYKVEVNKNTYELNAPTLFKLVSDLDKDKLYEVKVWAKNVVGYGNFSVKTFKTKPQGKPALPVLTVAIQKTLVKLSWSKPADNGGTITKYTVYQKEDGVDEEWKQVVKIYGDIREKEIENLEPGKKYSFIVTASNGFGESPINNDKKQTVEIPVQTTTPAATDIVQPSKGRSSGSGSNTNQTIIIVGAVVAVVLIVITAVISIIILRKKDVLGKRKPSSNRSAAYHNDGQSTPDSLDRGAAVVNLHDDGVPTYAAVDKTKKTKKKGQTEIPNYAAVDKSMKKKRPGEIIYAELADFNTNNIPAAPRPVPSYAETDYADISQFQNQNQQEPTYANFSARNEEYNM